LSTKADSWTFTPPFYITKSFIQNTLSEVNFEDKKLTFQQKRRENKRMLPFCNAVSTISAQFETDHHEQMAFDYKATIT